MVVKNVTVNNCTPETIVIGRRGTFETMQVVFDLTYLIENYGDGTAVLALKRSQDSSAYPAVAAQDGNTLTWVVSEVDTYYVGAGVCQLMWYVDDGLAKTIIYPTVVMKDILSTAEEPPDGYENWIEHLTDLGAETLQNAHDAAQSASEAEQAKNDAVDAKEASEEAARKAEAASVHAPVIYGGYWFIWNNGQYVNTNVRAEGQKGDKGDTGEKGDIGNGISKIEKTGTSGLVDTYTVTYTDGTSTTFTVTNGAKGDKGDTGATGNGIQSITKTGTSGNVDTYTITYTNGQTMTFTVTNGAVTSVAGKTGAVTLDADDVAYDDSVTYAAGSLGAEVSQQKNALSALNGMIYSGTATDGVTLFTNEQVSEGDILYVSMTASSTSATFIHLLDGNGQRCGLFGKISGNNGNRHNVGVIKIPSGFDHAIMVGGATIHYLQKEVPAEFTTEIQNCYLGKKRNLLEGVSFQDKYGFNVGAGALISTQAGIRTTGYLTVIPKSKITLSYNLGSTVFGWGFFDEKLRYINGYVSYNNTEMIVPDGAYFAIGTITATYISNGARADITPPQESISEQMIKVVNPYRRYPVHQFGTLLNGYIHMAFPRMCYFNGKTVIVYVTGYQHKTNTDNTRPAIAQIDVRDNDGTWKHVRTISPSDFSGASGDTRDLYIQPTRDGTKLLMVGGFSRYVSNTLYRDCFIAVLDANLDIVDYKLFLNATDYFYGNPLITPEGHIIFTSFENTARQTNIYRSNEVFSGTVSTLTFTKTVATTDTSDHSESCLGYFNDELVLVVRYEGTNAAKMMVTSDLEGTSGWSTLTSIHISCQSPLLLPYYKGKYLPVVGSRMIGENNRVPLLVYLDVEASNYVAYCNLDDTLATAYNGYPSFAPLGAENYAVAYYQENPGGTEATYPNCFAGVYYKWINARELIPSLAYLDV